MDQTAPSKTSTKVSTKRSRAANDTPAARHKAVAAKVTIPRRANPEVAPLSLAQEGHWLFQLLFPDNAVLNTFRTWRPAAPLDLGLLERALTEIVSRHEILRTNFRVLDGVPAQVVRPPEPMTVGELDLTELEPAARKPELVRWLRQRTAKPFDLAQDPLFRSDLVRLSDDDHVVLLNLHHIICDGWSLGVLVREAAVLYAAFSRGKPHRLGDLPLQYGDYSAWQRARLKGEAIARQLAFWRARLAGAPAQTGLPLDHPRPPGRSFRGAQTSFTLDPALVTRLKLLCRREQVTPFMVLIAALATLLHRYSGETDIVIGSPVANRGLREIEPLIGLFMNNVVFRFDLAGDRPFRELLGRVRADAMAVFDNQDVAFESVLDALGIGRDGNRSPLFQVMFVMQPPRASSVFAELGVEATELTSRGSKFDLTFAMGESEDGDISGMVEYATDLFEASTVDRLFRHYVALLEAVSRDPRQTSSGLPMFAEAERRQLVDGWRPPASPYPETCLHDLFSAQAARTPEAVALRSATGPITYRALEQTANRLAWHLRSRGVGPDIVVGLCLRRSPAQVIAVLAILKAGGAYLPLDPNDPPDRLARMMADARPRVLVTDQALSSALRAGDVPTVMLDRDEAAIACRPGEPPPSATRPDHLACVLFTSGSTGRAKGVMVTHRSLVNRLHWDVPGPETDDIYVYKTTLGFIDAVWEIVLPLIRGQSTIIVPDDVGYDPARLIDLMAREGATRIVLVPSLLRAILDCAVDLERRLPRLRHWACSGEALPAALAAAFRARLPQAELFNIYGTSEFWDATSYRARDQDKGPGVPIGLPIANMRAIVLGPSLEPVPIGAAGELFIAGAGLARGYVGRPGLTADRFRPDPFGDGGRIYRSGDLARRRADGILEFAGRRDHQVKLRGYRIELVEVESALQAHDMVRLAIVLMRDDLPSGEPGLVAYLTPEARVPAAALLREYLLARLPSHMIPAHFVMLTELPMTPSGKVDRAALPRPLPKLEPSRGHVAPQSDVELMLAGIWSEVLGIDRIGIDDNFFELGANSMTLVRVQGLIRDRFDRDIPIVVLFRYPTIRAFGSYMVDGHREDILAVSTKRGEARQKFLTRRTRVDVRPIE